MSENEIVEFDTVLRQVCSLTSRGKYVPTADDALLFFRSLAAFPLEAVKAGFQAHIADEDRGRFTPLPSDIIRHIRALEQRIAQRPSADEAWATALRSTDESATVVWTDEMELAWANARPVLDLGRDEVGARLAFRAAYDRITARSITLGVAPVWKVSEGFDAEGRTRAVAAAVDAGIPLQGFGAQPLLTGVRGGQLSLPALVKSAEQEGSGCPPEILAKLRQLRDDTVARMAGGGESRADRERERLAEVKAESRRAVEGYAAAAGMVLSPVVVKAAGVAQ